MKRIVRPEILDELSPNDAQAAGSRNDLRKLNRIMGHAGILANAIRDFLKKNPAKNQPLQICELGAGDGTLLLEIARRLSAHGIIANVKMIDRRSIVSGETRRAFAALNWQSETISADVFSWLEKSADKSDIVIANLFLHHFEPGSLQKLLRLASEKTGCFLACEPRRSLTAISAARLLGVIGCNAITCHDAVVSVRAGFANHDLSALWSAENDWQCRENSSGLFTHFFMADKATRTTQNREND